MQALGLVRIRKKPNLVEIPLQKFLSVKKWGWAMRAKLRTPPENPRTSQNYRIVGLLERRQPLGQLM